MEYYVVLNRERKGPFTIDQLKTMDLTPHTMVWCKGMPNWAKAQEVAELVEILKIENKEEAPDLPLELPDDVDEEVYTDEYEDKEDALRAKRKKDILVCAGAFAAILIISLLVYWVNKAPVQEKEV